MRRPCASEYGKRCVTGARAVADDFPSKAGAHLSKSIRLCVTKYDGVLRVEGDNEVITVASKCHQPFRMLHAGGQRTLL
jgi:hypothetical protein